MRPRSGATSRSPASFGITGVPFFVFGGRFGVSGAQPIEVLLGALERAGPSSASRSWSPRAIDDIACALDGCA